MAVDRVSEVLDKLGINEKVGVEITANWETLRWTGSIAFEGGHYGFWLEFLNEASRDVLDADRCNIQWVLGRHRGGLSIVQQVDAERRIRELLRNWRRPFCISTHCQICQCELPLKR